MKSSLIRKANRILKDDLITITHESKNDIWYEVATVGIRYCKRIKEYHCYCKFHTLKDVEGQRDCAYTYAVKTYRARKIG